MLALQVTEALSNCNSSFPNLVFIKTFSGITAAKSLIEAGITDIIILEATDRIGGRIRNQNFSGLNVMFHTMIMTTEGKP